jgi:hypothetical protein
MKHLLTPLAALVLTVSGWSLQQSASAPPLAQRQPQACRTSDDADAIHRHRTCQPQHWRGMLLQRN